MFITCVGVFVLVWQFVACLCDHICVVRLFVWLRALAHSMVCLFDCAFMYVCLCVYVFAFVCACACLCVVSPCARFAVYAFNGLSGCLFERLLRGLRIC